MMVLRGRFDGRGIVLDEPPPAELQPDTSVEIVVVESREQALRKFLGFLDELEAQAKDVPPHPTGRGWTREELYERGGKRLS